MGHSSKFYFPIPGRKQKAPAPIIAPVPPPNGAPLTKAQRILGTGPINIDSAGASSNTKRAWDGQSNVAISVSVTDTSATEWDNAGSRLGSGHHDDRRVGSGHRDRRWEEESEVLPKDGLTVTMGHDDTTDASSLRRRQSSSTIRSYYDKAKVPLSISQQTANSAMAKGLPSNSKAHALLDIEGNFDTQRLKNKKKPSRLDLSSLIPRHKSSKTHLRPEPERTHVLGPDLLTKSPSIMSISPAPTPPPIVQRIERKLRSKMTKESLRSISSVPDTIPPLSVTHSDPTKQPSIKANPQLHNLYDHYEQRTFEDALERDLHASQGRAPPPDRPLPAYPTPPTSNTGNPSLSPFPRSTSRAGHQNPPPLTVTVPELQLSRPPSEPSLASPVADYASISSRHTRTSKASRRTDRSLTEIDLLQNSVLALSSDSEDDYEASNDQLSVPPPSDGPASPVSPRSALSQQYSKSDDGSRNKPLKQTTFAENPEFFPAKQEPKSAVPPKILARSSSLTVTSSNHSQIYPPNTRISNGTTSTAQTLGYSALLTPTTHEANAINMVPQSKFRDQTHAFRPVSEETQFEDFPAPPIHSAPRPGPTSHPAERTSLLSPTRVDFYLQSQHISVARDNASIRSDASHGSGGNARRGSATSSLNDSGSGRFMAVTRQEEALLAALRQKRARMREHILAEYEETDRSGSAVSNSRPRKNANSPLSEKAEHGRILFMMDEADSDVTGLVQLDEFPAPAEFDRRRSRSAAAQRPLMSTPSQRQRPQRSSSLPGRSSDHSSPKTAPANNRPNRIAEDPCEDDENQGVPRPDSPISPADFPAPVSSMNNKIVNKKQVRLSAVGSYKPNVEAGWWDDSG